MSSPLNSGGIPPAAAAEIVPGRDDSDLVDGSTEGGTPVGAADADEDARRAGADRDSPVGTLGMDAGSDADRATDDGVPVGEADAEADRLAASADDRR